MTTSSRPSPPAFVGMWLILLAAMLWGTTGTAQGLAPASATPLTVGIVRLALGGSALLFLALWRRQLFGGPRWPLGGTAISAVFVAAYQLSFFAAVDRTGVAVGTMVAIGSSPVAAGVLGYLIRRERLDRRWFLATGLALAGCVLLVMSGGQLSLNLLGIFLAFGAGFSYAMYTVSIKGLLDTHSPDAVMAVVFFSAALLMVPVMFFLNWNWVFTLRGGAVALHLGVVTAALSYWLFARGLRLVKIGHVATLTLAEPLTAALLGVLVLHETLGIIEVIGICLIFSGISVLALAPSRQT